jgi:hypothetical protein
MSTDSFNPNREKRDFLLLPTVNVEVFTIALVQFAKAVGAGADRHVVLMLDRAGWHKSQMLTVPDGIHLVFLPPSSRRPPTG